MNEKEDKKKLKKYFDKWEKKVIDNPYYSESTKNFLLNHKKSFSYNWSKEALENGITLKEIKKIEKYLDIFYSETCDGYILRYYNGFVGAGILEIPADHRTKKINPIFIFSCGHNKKSDDIEEIINTFLTLDEAKDLVKAINICIEKFKKEVKND